MLTFMLEKMYSSKSTFRKFTFTTDGGRHSFGGGRGVFPIKRIFEIYHTYIFKIIKLIYAISPEFFQNVTFQKGSLSQANKMTELSGRKSG